MGEAAKTARVDLFGDPIREARDGPGRPEHVWTKENSNKISLLFACGYQPKDAAQAIGVSVPTLRKHYFSELEQWRFARIRMEAKLLAQLNAEGEKGSVGAMKELAKRIDKGRLEALAERVADRGRKEPKRRLGKKEQQHEAAQGVRGKFAPPEAPALLN